MFRASRGMGSIRCHWGLLGGVGDIRDPSQGVGGIRGALGAGRECRCSGASMGIGGIRGIGGS